MTKNRFGGFFVSDIRFFETGDIASQ